MAPGKGANAQNIRNKARNFRQLVNNELWSSIELKSGIEDLLKQIMWLMCNLRFGNNITQTIDDQLSIADFNSYVVRNSYEQYLFEIIKGIHTTDELKP